MKAKTIAYILLALYLIFIMFLFGVNVTNGGINTILDTDALQMVAIAAIFALFIIFRNNRFFWVLYILNLLLGLIIVNAVYFLIIYLALFLFNRRFLQINKGKILTFLIVIILANIPYLGLIPGEQCIGLLKARIPPNLWEPTGPCFPVLSPTPGFWWGGGTGYDFPGHPIQLPGNPIQIVLIDYSSVLQYHFILIIVELFYWYLVASAIYAIIPTVRSKLPGRKTP